MSHSASYGQTEHAARPRTRSAAAVSRHVQRGRDGYTLQHAGRQIRIGPVAFWIVVGTLVVMAVWSILTGTYFAFREDVLTGLIGRQAQMQFAYEDRIGFSPFSEKHSGSNRFLSRLTSRTAIR